MCLIFTFSFQIQNKLEKKPGTPLPPPATFPSAPQPLSPVPHVNKVVNAPLSINIPQFYFPEGLPDACSNHEQILSRIEAAFMDIEDQKADIYEMGKIAKVIQLLNDVFLPFPSNPNLPLFTASLLSVFKHA